MPFLARSLFIGLTLCFFFSSALADKRSDAFGDWAVFVDNVDNPRKCWAITKFRVGSNATGQDYFLSVTRFHGNRTPEVSVYTGERMRKSTGMYLSVADRVHGLRSDGTGAWPPTRSDKRIVSDMRKVEKAREARDRSVRIGWKGGREFVIPTYGFGKAMDEVLKFCNGR